MLTASILAAPIQGYAESPGAPTYKQTGGDVHYNWGYGSPEGIPNDKFLGEFDQSRTLSAGDYFVQTYADDGVQVQVDGKTIIDRWSDGWDTINRAVLPQLSAGAHSIQTHYYENVGQAAIFSDVVPFNSWAAYYYANESLSGAPAAAKVLQPSSDGGLLEDNGTHSPVPGKIGEEHFSARYVTAKRLVAGEYILQAGADDGIRVYIDGKLVLDRWMPSAFRTATSRIAIADNTKESEKDVHWVEVQYLEKEGQSKVAFNLEPYSSFIQNSSVTGEFYNNKTLSGTPAAFAGQDLNTEGNGLSFNWGYDAPMPGVNADRFSAVFHENKSLASGDYFLQTLADDGIKVELDGQTKINRWSAGWNSIDRAVIPQLTEGKHQLKTSYYEGDGGAALYSHLVPFNNWLVYYYPNDSLSGIPEASKILASSEQQGLLEDNGTGSPVPGKVSEDHFSARYVTAKRIQAGEYILRAGADDGIRVYIDDKLVLDRWTPSGFRTNSTKVKISDNPNEQEKDVHWIEVQYFEAEGQSKVEFTLDPYSSFLSKAPIAAEFYNNQKLSSPAAAVGGYELLNGSDSISFNWGYAAPLSGVGADNFSAVFYENKNLTSGNYFLQTLADDGVKVEVNGQTKIDRWKSGWNSVNRAVVPWLSGGNMQIKTSYYEESGEAALFSNLVRFNDWLAYYYPNESLSGTPVASKIIKSSDNIGLYEENGTGSPVPNKIGNEHFSAKYVTAKRVRAGKYAIRTKADDGIRVYVDGKLVLDRWTPSALREDIVTLDIADNQNAPADEKDVHWIDVEYLEATGQSHVEVTLEDYDRIGKDAYLTGEFYNNRSFSGPSYISFRGSEYFKNTSNLAFNWKNGSPAPGIGADNFSAVFREHKPFDGGDYFLQTFADDGVKVEVDGRTQIERWSGNWNSIDRALLPQLSNGIHEVKTAYNEASGGAALYSSVVPLDQWLGYYYDNTGVWGAPIASKVLSTLSERNGTGSPAPGIPSDNFSARYVTAKHMSAGNYKIKLKADDGYRVYVDNKLVLDGWTDGAAYFEDTAVFRVEDGTNSVDSRLKDVHWIEVQYYEKGGNSTIEVTSLLPTNEPATPRATRKQSILLDAPLISQLPELKNGCEVTSLAMLLRYKGINVDKMTLASRVVKDLTPYRQSGDTIYWGNPNTGFVGDITGKTKGYSAYHDPIMQLASRYTNAVDLTGSSFDTILTTLAQGKPVWVISTSTFDIVPNWQWQTWQTPIGPIRITFHEHSVLLTGFDSEYIYFNDPLANIKNRKVLRSSFVHGWEQFGNQAITYQ